MKVSIQGLKQGISVFNEDVPAVFVDQEYSQYYPNTFSVEAIVDKIERDFRVKIAISTIANYECDRCLESFKTDFKAEQEQMYKMASADKDGDQDTIVLAADAKEIDLVPLLREAVVLQHPIKMLCKEECKGLCVNCGANLNIERCSCHKSETDPRWDELRKLVK
jgi:uncharacterized protein